MKYSIITLDDESRSDYKFVIRKRVNAEEIHVPAVDGRQVDIEAELEKRGLKITGYGFTKGEIGIWLSVFDQWEWIAKNNEPLIVFEDDAVPTRDFNKLFSEFKSELPADFDFLSLWIPDNQVHDYIYDVVFDEHGSPTHVGPNRIAFTSIFNFGSIRLAKSYQGYGNVAMYYSPQGAQKLIDEIRRQGLYQPVDCWIFAQSFTRRVNGYAPKPVWAKAVSYDWNAETTVHNTEKI